MKVSGLKTIEKAKEWSGIPMETNMKVISSGERRMEKASITGPTEKCTMASGARASKRATACGEVSLETLT